MRPTWYVTSLILFLLSTLAANTSSSDPAGVKAERRDVGAPKQWTGEIDYERFSKEVMGALERADPVAMSLLVNFPLRVNFADGTTTLIQNEYTLQKRFDQIFPKSFRDQILAVSKAGTGEDGWVGNGYMIANGSLWANKFGEPVGARFRIETVNSSIPGDQHAPLSTLFACETEKHRIVVDSDGPAGSLRYRAWNKPHFPPNKPDLTLLNGEGHSSGTGGCFARSWLFKTGSTDIEIQEIRCTAGEDSPPGDARAAVSVSVDGKAGQPLYCF